MGLAGYNRDFIPNFAALAAPLSDLTRKGQPNKVEWGQAQEKAYLSIKALLTREPILQLPDPEKTYFLRTDASDDGIGAALMQEHDGKLFSVCYGNKKLSSAECNYSTIEKVFNHCVWIQKVSPVFIRSSLCAANRSRATEVYEQCKVYQRTSHALGYVSPERQFQS